LIKPDGVAKRKIGEVISRLETKGLTMQGLKMIWLDEELAAEHYREHQGKDFYERLLAYITERPVVAMVVAGKSAIRVVRNLAGTTDPVEAKPGTIRGDLALDMQAGNIIHASDSPDSAQREIDLFFDSAEIYDY